MNSVRSLDGGCMRILENVGGEYIAAVGPSGDGCANVKWKLGKWRRSKQLPAHQ